MKQKSRIFYLGHPISSAFFCCWPHHQLWPACSSTPRCLEAVYLWKSDDRYLPLKAISSMVQADVVHGVIGVCLHANVLS